MSTNFHSKKHDIIQRLSVSTESYTDASPKGSVDEDIRELVDEINGTDGLVTTSSCSGRVAVYIEGPKNATLPSQSQSPSESENPSQPVRTAGGKGGGKWLFTSHSPITIPPLNAQPNSIFSLLNLLASDSKSHPGSTSALPASQAHRPQYIHIKFEPMILHILTSTPPTAQKVLNAALSAGFRESGISSLLDGKGASGNPMVAVRTAGLGLDSIIGFVKPSPSPGGDPSAGLDSIQMLVSEEYLRMLLSVANERFEINSQRTSRFREALKAQFETAPSGSQEFEPMEVRRERMRREGLLRRDLMKGDAAAQHRPVNGESDDYGFSGLLAEQ